MVSLKISLASVYLVPDSEKVAVIIGRAYCTADRIISGLLTASNGAGRDFFGGSVGIDGDSKILC